nr:hypothetical protein [Candidatus Sigynarchaeota archaeon]
MSQETKSKPESQESLKTAFRIEKQRYNWIDQARGFVMFILVLSGLMPELWRKANAITWFFLEHPDDSTHAQYMNFYDIGVPAFFFIIGLLMAVSFKKRLESKGPKPAVLNALVRWGLVSAVGILFIIIPGLINGDDPSTWFGEVKTIAPGIDVFVVYWDVVISLGIVGLVSIPFLFMKRTPRLIVSYAMMAFYQVMLFIPETHWRDYAISSVHGGIIGGFLVLVPITLIASVVGEFFILDKETPEHEKVRKFLMLGLVNAIIGVVLWLIPGGYPNKRQDTMSWAAISIAVCFFIGFLFLKVDYKDEEYKGLHPANKGRIVLFKSYGMNPFLIYGIAEIAGVVIEALVGSDFEIQLAQWLILVPAITLIAWILYKKGKAISTTKVALGVIVIVLVLAVVLIPLL